VVRLVGRQHVIGDGAYDVRHPPPKSDDVAVILSQGECLTISEHLIGQVLRRGRPNGPDEREPNLDDGSPLLLSGRLRDLETAEIHRLDLNAQPGSFR
jgi:hypothetical protein